MDEAAAILRSFRFRCAGGGGGEWLFAWPLRIRWAVVVKRVPVCASEWCLERGVDSWNRIGAPRWSHKRERVSAFRHKAESVLFDTTHDGSAENESTRGESG